MEVVRLGLDIYVKHDLGVFFVHPLYKNMRRKDLKVHIIYIELRRQDKNYMILSVLFLV